MQVTVQEKNSFTRVLNITVDEAEVNAKYEEVIKGYRKEVAIPGFRPGTAPRELIIKKLGKVLREEAVEKVLSNAFRDACKENKLEPIAMPVINNVKSQAGEPLSFEASIEIDPPVTIEKYKNLGIKVVEKPVTEADIDEVLAQIRERFSTLKTVEREIKKGDYAEMDYKKVVIDGVEKNDHQSPRYPVEIGASEYLKDFESQIIGMKKGDEKTIEFSFPEDYNYKAVSGKKAAFTVLIKEVKEKEMPALDDKLAADATPRAKNLAELREVIKNDLAEERKESSINEAHEKAIDAVIAANPFDVPESRIANYSSHAFDSFKKQYPYSEVKMEEFAARNKEHIIRDIKRFKILEVLGEKESVKATGEEVDAEITKIAAARREGFDKVKETLRKNGQTVEIRERIRDRKVLDLLVEGV
ncbi:MAG: trigger factor [Fibrobacteres bacterium]|nr:trigger factor [Fibrobacterota bacterium]